MSTYLPTAFREDDTETALGLIEAHDFGLLIVHRADGVQVSHLPFLLDRGRGSHGHLRCHVARANPIWRDIERASVLAVFSGPNHYVSPDWYETARMVPTWNYAAVYAGVRARVLDDAATAAVVEDLSRVHEEPLLPKRPWTVAKLLDNEYAALRKAIVGLDLEITSLQAKVKMSQNRKPEDAAGAIAGLEALGTPEAAAVAAMMRDATG